MIIFEGNQQQYDYEWIDIDKQIIKVTDKNSKITFIGKCASCRIDRRPGMNFRIPSMEGYCYTVFDVKIAMRELIKVKQ